MFMTHQILSDISSGISEFKKNPMSVIEQGDGGPIAILNRNKPAFYVIPAELFEKIMDRLEDIELVKIVKERENDPEIEVNIDDL